MPDPKQPSADDDAARLAEELRVHQIELEMQNEELRGAQLGLEEQRAQYFDLFALAPIGYLTLSDMGVALDANLTAARLLGVERQRIVGKPFSAFIMTADRDEYYLHHRVLQQTGEPQAFELRLRRVGDDASLTADSDHFWAHLESRPQRKADQVGFSSWVTFTDISENRRAQDVMSMQRDLSLALGMSDDLNHALELILDTALLIETIDSGGVYVTDATGALDLAVHRGLTPEFLEQATHYAPDAPQARLAHGGQTHYGSLRSIRKGPNETEDAEGLRGLAVIPIMHEGQLMALLNLASHTHDEIPISARDTLEALAAQIGSTLMRLHSDAALRESRRNLQTLFDTVDDFLFVLDGTGHILQTNAMARSRLGYSHEELAGQDVLMVHPPERRAEAAAIIAAMLAGERDSCPVDLQAKDGTLIPVETKVTPGVWAGAPALFGLSRDVTERAQAHQTEALLRRMLETVPDPIWLKDTDGVFLGGNHAHARLLGVPDSEIVGKTDYDFYDSALADSFHAYDLAAMEADAPVVNEEWATFADDGHRALLQTIKTPMLDEAGSMLGVLGVAREVTELRSAQDALRDQNALLEGMSRATDHIISDATLTDDNVTAALRELGLASSVDRVYIFEHKPGPGDSRGCISQRYEWSLAGVEPQIDNPDLQDVPWDDVAPRWHDTFLAGGHIAGDVADFPDDERAVLEPQDIISLLALPIETSGQLWGFIGFDACTTTRTWRSAEVGLLRSVANSLGVAIGHMRVEAALQESEENFRSFFETVDDMLLVGSPDGRIVYANPSVSTKLDYTPAELLTMNVLDLNVTDRRAEAEAIFAAMLKGERDSCPLPLQTKTGALVPAETRVWFGRWNGADCIFGVSKDLTKEQQALQKFDQLFQNNPAAMAVSDMPGGGFSDVNDAFVRGTGYAREEIIGRTTGDLGLAVYAHQQQELARQLRTYGRIDGCELKVKRKDGTLIDGLFSGEVIQVQGREHFLTVMLDVSAIKKAEHAESTLTSVIDVIGSLSEMRDPYTAGHQRRVAELATQIALDMGMSGADTADIRMAGQMLDIGKMAVPAEILSKPGVLSSTELLLVHSHVEAGYNIIAATHMRGPIAEFVYQHHERCDGSGYPRGLVADELLLGSKVLMVADVVEAMSSHRPYRAALGQDMALVEIAQGVGTLYDSAVVESCLRLFREGGFSFPEA